MDSIDDAATASFQQTTDGYNASINLDVASIQKETYRPWNHADIKQKECWKAEQVRI
jgi:hypothetical protein